MDYNQTLNWLFNQLPMYQRQGKAAYKADLNNTLELDRYFNYPHKKFKSIHVAGTNGKGSVSHMIASVLQESGYKVGLYTSPHLRDFRERIKINGEMISEDFVVDFVNKHQSKFEEIEPSFFEMTVAMAFDYFAKQKIDIAVVEVGMGGRLDSTNIISPELSVITNIGFDHTAFLGNTLAEIANEKAGIIKENIPVVVGETQLETEGVFKEKAKEKDTEIYFADQKYEVGYALLSTDNKQVFQVYEGESKKYKDLKLDLLGSYQLNNLKTVLNAFDLLSNRLNKITIESIYNGLEKVVENTGLLGRWQILGVKPLTICDTGHNKEGLTYIIEQIKQTVYKKLHFVLGVVDDKNIDQILEMMPKDALYYFTNAKIPRALNKDVLKTKAEKYSLKGLSYETVEDALKNAKKNAGDNDLIFIGGSTFVVAEVV